MRRTLTILSLAALLAAAGCSTGSDTGSASPGASTAPRSAAGRRPRARPASSGTAFDPMSVSGDLTLQGWSAGAVEAPILDKVLEDFQAEVPEHQGEVRADRRRLRRRDGREVQLQDVPDVFYVDSGPAATWIDDGSLEPLDDYIAKSGFDTRPSTRPTSTRSRAPTASSTACPRTATRSRWPTTRTSSTAAGVTAPPTTWEELPPPSTSSRASPGSTRRCACRPASTARSRSSTRRAAACSTRTRPRP